MEISDLQIFDYIILTIIAGGGYLGWKNGLIQTFIVFFAWVGSAIIAFDNYDLIHNLLSSYINSKFISAFMASIGVYIILVVLFSMLGEKLSRKASKFGGGVTDQITGVVFGFVCGCVIACSVFWVSYVSFYTLNDKKLPEWLAKAKTYKPLKIGSDTLVSIIASEEERAKLMNLMRSKSSKLEEEVKNNIKQESENFSKQHLNN